MIRETFAIWTAENGVESTREVVGMKKLDGARVQVWATRVEGGREGKGGGKSGAGLRADSGLAHGTRRLPVR